MVYTESVGGSKSYGDKEGGKRAIMQLEMCWRACADVHGGHRAACFRVPVSAV